MREITLRIDDDTKLVSITTISSKPEHYNVNCKSFEIKTDTIVIEMPEAVESEQTNK